MLYLLHDVAFLCHFIKIWNLSFLHEKWNSLHLIYENLGGGSLPLNVEICIFHIWKSWHWLSENKENQWEISNFSIAQMIIWTPLFLHTIERVCISQIYIKTNSLNCETCNVLYLLYHHLGAHFSSRMLDLSILHIWDQNGDFSIKTWKSLYFIWSTGSSATETPMFPVCLFLSALTMCFCLHVWDCCLCFVFFFCVDVCPSTANKSEGDRSRDM